MVTAWAGGRRWRGHRQDCRASAVPECRVPKTARPPALRRSLGERHAAGSGRVRALVRTSGGPPREPGPSCRSPRARAGCGTLPGRSCASFHHRTPALRTDPRRHIPPRRTRSAPGSPPCSPSNVPALAGQRPSLRSDRIGWAAVRAIGHWYQAEGVRIRKTYQYSRQAETKAGAVGQSNRPGPTAGSRIGRADGGGGGDGCGEGSGRRIATTITTRIPSAIRTSPTLNTLASGIPAGSAKMSPSGARTGDASAWLFVNPPVRVQACHLERRPAGRHRAPVGEDRDHVQARAQRDDGHAANAEVAQDEDEHRAGGCHVERRPDLLQALAHGRAEQHNLRHEPRDGDAHPAKRQPGQALQAAAQQPSQDQSEDDRVQDEHRST